MKSKMRYFIKVRKKSGEYPQTKGYSPDFSPRRREGVAKSSNLMILQHPHSGLECCLELLTFHLLI